MTINDDLVDDPPPSRDAATDGALVDCEGIQKLLGFPVSKATLMRWGRLGGWFPKPADLPGVRRTLWWRNEVLAAIEGRRAA